MDLKQSIQEVVDATREHKLRVSDDMVLDVAGRIYNTHLINSYKQGKVNVSDAPTKDSFKPLSQPSPATSNQIKALKKHGYEGDTSKLTKKEASELIKRGVGQ